MLKVAVAQLGARMHYAVPRILAHANALEYLYTDIYASKALRTLLAVPGQYGPPALRRWLGRVPQEIPEEKIRSFPLMGLEYYWRLSQATRSDRAGSAHLWAGSELCRRAISRGLGNASCVYTYNSAGLELLEYARANNILAVMEQTIAPASVEGRLLEEEISNHPRWVTTHRKNAFRQAYSDREYQEWTKSDLILCGSEFVRNGIQEAGGPTERCVVVPYGIRLPEKMKAKDAPHRPLRVLTIGAVGLRKGSPYVLGAARLLKSKVEFRMVGILDVSDEAQDELSSHVQLTAAVPRSEISRQYEWADVFLLPSICEGSATVCYEALAQGLPVITTANSGSVVRDGVDGFIVPIRDSEAIAEKIERFLHEEMLLATMSRNALARASEYTLEKYGERLLSAFGKLIVRV